MYASVSIATLKPGCDEELRHLSLERGIPTLRAQPGFRGCQAIHPRDGSWIICTYWETAKHCETGVAAMNEAIRERYAPILEGLERHTGVVEYTEDVPGTVKATVLYGPPASAADFERYYFEKHLALASKLPSVRKVEIAKVLPDPQAEPPAHYRLAELWFDSAGDLQASIASPEGQAVLADLSNFATGGATILVSAIG